MSICPEEPSGNKAQIKDWINFDLINSGLIVRTFAMWSQVKIHAPTRALRSKKWTHAPTSDTFGPYVGLQRVAATSQKNSLELSQQQVKCLFKSFSFQQPRNESSHDDGLSNQSGSTHRRPKTPHCAAATTFLRILRRHICSYDQLIVLLSLM